ncbi:MAG: metallophosphoesterase [Caulobacteraceae bacterium]
MQVRANWSKGQISLSEAERVCARLSKSEPDALRVVLCHHPLMEVTGGPMTGRVWRGERGAEILAQGGADLILTGHVHMPFAHPLPFTDQRTYAVGASTLSLRERNCPAGFNVIEADPGCIQVTALGWTGTGFEAQRTWGFDRRRREAPASVVTPESDPRSDPRPVRP